MRSIAKLRILIAAGLLGLLAGCGAGGGGGSTTYSITLSAKPATLSLNIDGTLAAIGNPYTATLYIDAQDSAGNPIPGGTNVFGCAIVGGLPSGALYYLDSGDYTDTTRWTQVSYTTPYCSADTPPKCYVPSPMRSITLDANSGAATFHFESSDWAGTSTIRCSVSDPNGVQHSASTTIQVGDATGLASQIVVTALSPNYLYVQGAGSTTNLQIQAQLLDSAGQVITPPTGADDVQVRIIPDSTTLADDDALLRGQNANGQLEEASVINVQSINGQAQFTLISGTHTGNVLIEVVSDHADNNVDNGIAEPVYNYISVPVISQVASGTALSITTATLPDATGNIPYAVALQATGGTLPYTWTLVQGSQLPEGMYLTSSGVVAGDPFDTNTGTYNFVVQVTDANGNTAQENMSLAYKGVTITPAASAPTITTTSLSSATTGVSYAQVLTATGGTPPYVWYGAGLPSWLTLSNAGILTGTPPGAETDTFGVTVAGSDGLQFSKTFTLTVN